MANKKGSYELVESVMVDCYGGGLGEYNEKVMNDFYSSFEKGVDVSKNKFFEFCNKYIDDVSERYYIRLNWEFIISGGDESVYEEC
jgi:hypothetical protein